MSLWLNAGVPGSQIAVRAGHSVHVLLKVCAIGFEGPRRRINVVLEVPDDATAV